MAKIKGNYLIQKQNVLNEIHANNMTLQELRFFSIYLSKINKNDISTRLVRFKIDDFKAIIELNSRANLHLVDVTNSLLCKVVNVPNEHGGYTGFQLFKECTVSKDECGDWYVEIDAHDKALPLMFEFKNKFFSYRLWNALRLKSSNQIRMYEILKQYQTKGERILTIDELKALLGIGKDEYPRFGDFKKWVLNVCQKALEEYTDIKFTYEPHGKKGKGGKILTLKFKIKKNDNYKDPLLLDTFIDTHKTAFDDVLDLNYIDSDTALEMVEYGEITKRDELIINLREVMNNEFSFEQTQELYDIVISSGLNFDYIKLIHHFQAKYSYAKRVESEGKIKKSVFALVRSIIDKPSGEVSIFRN